MEGRTRNLTFVIVTIVAVCLSTQSGCINFAAHMINTFKGHKMKAEYDALSEKRVAIVCVSDSSAYGPDVSAELISKAVRSKFQKEKLELELVPQSEIDNWLDNNWEDIDYVEIGKAVNAEKVLAIDLDNYSLHEGSTLYKGRATYNVRVFDMEQGGQVAFSRGPNEFQFPSNHGTPATTMSENQFQMVFVYELANDIAKYFYDYDIPETIARNAAHIGE